MTRRRLWLPDRMRPGHIHGSGRGDDPRAGYTYWPLQQVDVCGQWRDEIFAIALAGRAAAARTIPDHGPGQSDR